MTLHASSDLLQKLPSVDEVAHRSEFAPLGVRHGQAAVIEAVRMVLKRLRKEISDGVLNENGIHLALGGIFDAVKKQLDCDLSFSLRSVINATGVILHTNLGRAPLAVSALDHLKNVTSGYSNLEFNIGPGERGKRDAHIDRLFQRLFPDVGPQPLSTIVVNNNAAAVLLALNTMAEGGEVIVSRGELVEIGGSFRIPDVMAKSNAILREVGTTNRTRTSDYERAINERTRLLLRVHRSNFEVVGFTEQPAIEELAAVAEKHGLPLMEDLGSGALFDLNAIGIRKEPSVLDSLRSGVHIVTYSGDKLLGGPQAGLLSGRSDLISRMRSNSLFRALRVDKLTYAVLEATLLAYVKHDYDSVPALRMMRLSREDVGRRAETMAEKLASSKLSVEVMDGDSLIGGGAAPSAKLPTRLLAISHGDLTADQIAASLRKFSPPIVTRIEEGRVLLDLRTVFPEQDDTVVAALRGTGE